MALAPAFKAHRIGPASSLHTLELYVPASGSTVATK